MDGVDLRSDYPANRPLLSLEAEWPFTSKSFADKDFRTIVNAFAIICNYFYHLNIKTRKLSLMPIKTGNSACFRLAPPTKNFAKLFFYEAFKKGGFSEDALKSLYNQK